MLSAYQWQSCAPTFRESANFIWYLIDNFKTMGVYKPEADPNLTQTGFQRVNMLDLDYQDRLRVITTAMQLLADRKIIVQDSQYLITSDKRKLDRKEMTPIYDILTMFVLHQTIPSNPKIDADHITDYVHAIARGNRVDINNSDLLGKEICKTKQVQILEALNMRFKVLISNPENKANRLATLFTSQKFSHNQLEEIQRLKTASITILKSMTPDELNANAEKLNFLIKDPGNLINFGRRVNVGRCDTRIIADELMEAAQSLFQSKRGFDS